MKKIAILILLGNVTFLLHAQDVIYTINCKKEGVNTYVDSILFENLSNDKRIVFQGLPIQDSYVINLNSQKLEGASGSLNVKDEDQLFKIIRNVPGEISLQGTNKNVGYINVSVFDLSGQLLYSQKINSNAITNTMTVHIPNSGIYILKIHSTIGDLSFKALGSGNSGSIGYTLGQIKSETTLKALKSASNEQESDFSFQTGDSLRIIAYLDGSGTYPVGLKVNGSDSLNLFFVGNDENFFVIDNTKYPLNLGYNIWFSELDCGGFDIIGHGLYFTSDILIAKYGDDLSGISLLPSGIGNILAFNLFNKDSVLIPGRYVFVDDISCEGDVTDADSTYVMSSTDKFVTAIKAMIDPTHYAINVDLEIDWDTVDLNNPSEDVVIKYDNYLNSMIGIKEGSVIIEKIGNIYTITFDCIDFNDLKITGKFKGQLDFVEFGI